MSKFAKNVDAYDGTALGDVPPRSDVPRGSPSPDAIPSATGRPSGVKTADGTDNMRADRKDLDAGDSRPKSSGNKNMWPAGVSSYDDSKV